MENMGWLGRTTLLSMRISDGLISTSDFIGLISFSRRTYGRKLLCNLCVTFRPQLPAEVVQSRYSFTHKILFCFRWIIFMGIKTISGFSGVFSGKRVLIAFSKRTPWKPIISLKYTAFFMTKHFRGFQAFQGSVETLKSDRPCLH